MAKNTKKRAIIYSNVKENQKRAEEISRIKENQINLNDEVIIGMSNPKNNKLIKSKNNKPVKSKKKVSTDKSRHNNNPEGTKRKPINSKKKKKLIKIVRIFLLITIGIILLIILLKSPLFNIKEINVKIENNNILTESQIKQLSQVNIGQNLYSISKKKIAENIKNNPYVESVKINRSIPSTLKIEIKERTVGFRLDYNGEFIYVDNQGYILEKTSEPNSEVIITGYSTTDLADGNRLNKEDLQKLSAVIQIMQEANNNGIKDDITKIDIQDEDDYKIYFDALGKMAHLGGTTYVTEKLTYVKKILEVENDYEGEIFVNVNLNNGEHPYFREKV